MTTEKASDKLRNSCDETIVGTAMRKLRGNSGETIVEALVSLIIAVISIALLVTSITAASKINEKSKARTSEQLSFEYVELADSTTGTTGSSETSGTSGTESAKPTQESGTVKIEFADTSLNESGVQVTVYTTKNGYVYYRK